MFWQLFTAAWLWLFVFGQATGGRVDCRAAGPIFRRTAMSEKVQTPEFPERATQATTRPMTVPLDEFLLKEELFCHRDKAELEAASLQTMMNSLVVEGLQVPIPFSRDSDSKPVPVGGHRRIKSMRLLAERNTPGFTPKMPVPSIEILGATPQDLICRSVADNFNRKGHTIADRIKTAVTMHTSGVEVSRAAHAMELSPKQYLRDLRIGQSDWMFTLVKNDHIGHTQASDLLEAAGNAQRMPDLESHVPLWVDERLKEARHRTSLLGKGKAAKEVKVKSLLTTKLSDHWIEQLKNGAKLDNELPIEPEAVFAGIDADANKLIFNEMEVDLIKIPLTDLAKMVGQIGGVRKVALSYLKSRFAVEGALGPQDVARKESQQASLDSLRAEGLGELADQLTPIMENPLLGDDDVQQEAKDGN